MKGGRGRKWMALTHGVGLLAGIALALALSPRGGGYDRDDGSAANRGRTAGAEVSKKRASVADGKGAPKNARFSTEEYREAWDAIASERLSKEERYERQLEVLGDWGAVDLRGALLAVMEGLWRGGACDPDDLANVFGEAISKNPLAAWEVLGAAEHVLGRPIFDEMLGRIFADHPEALPVVAGKLPPDLVRKCMEKVMGSGRFYDNPANQVAFLKQLAAAPPEAQGNGNATLELVIQAAMAVMPKVVEKPEPLLEKLGSAEAGRDRTVAMAQYLASLQAEPATMEAGWEKLPEELRAATVGALFRSAAVENAPLALIDLAVAEGRLDLLQDFRLVQAVDHHAGKTWKAAEREELAEWALALPAAPDVEQVFRKALYWNLNEGQAGARGWLEGLPPGWHRDQALALYAANLARFHPAETEWALGEISDAEVRKKLASDLRTRGD